MDRWEHGGSIYYGRGTTLLEFDPTWSGGRRPTMWFKRGTRPPGTADGGQITFVTGPVSDYDPFFECPQSHRLYAAFKSVVDGLPPEPFLDLLVEEFPEFEERVQRFVEGE